jgi:hypothetical protein
MTLKTVTVSTLTQILSPLFVLVEGNTNKAALAGWILGAVWSV